MTSKLDQDYRENEIYAHGFVWGRECAGDRDARSVDVVAFAKAYADQRRALATGEASSASSIQDAYAAWRETGSVVRPAGPLHQAAYGMRSDPTRATDAR